MPFVRIFKREENENYRKFGFEATRQKPLNRAQHVALTNLERDNLPAQVIVNGVTVETEVSDKRPLEVGDVLLDDAGHFYVVDAAPESVLMIKGDEEFAAKLPWLS